MEKIMKKASLKDILIEKELLLLSKKTTLLPDYSLNALRIEEIFQLAFILSEQNGLLSSNNIICAIWHELTNRTIAKKLSIFD